VELAGTEQQMVVKGGNGLGLHCNRKLRLAKVDKFAMN
jgi:hypothetical protein